MSRALVLQALEERRVLRLVYETGGTRMIQPHAIVRKTDGSEQLEAFQVQGHAEGGVEHGWKNFDLSRLQQVELGEERFEPRRDFKRVSNAFGIVIAGVRAMDQREP
ncbi:MAG: WYL domain-containing protein [Gemmatimonadaceae bacterium]|nr:WYL domain-containing protein [Gemmatimonadaceae bacterium]